jgi:hypothetical protein
VPHQSTFHEPVFPGFALIETVVCQILEIDSAPAERWIRGGTVRIELAIFRPWATSFAIVALSLAVTPVWAWAQNFSGDARSIGLETSGEQTNFASQLVNDSRGYRSIVIPLGLFQVFKDTNIFNPTNKSTFDPIRAMELAANPLHFTFNRNEGDTGEQLVQDLVNGQVSRDLNDYRGFIPARNVVAQGLINPSFGKTFRLRKADDGSFQGFYVGVGPYIALGTNFAADPTLIGLLASSTNAYLPNATLTLQDTTGLQAAAAATIGYRSHFSMPGQSSSRSKRDGIYVAVNYDYLRGLHYEGINLGVTFNTDATGLLTLQPTTVPIVVNRLSSSHGQGDAVDVGTHVISGRWNFRASANGIGNHINWSGLRAENYTLSSLLQSLSFVKASQPAPIGDIRVKLPVRYAVGAGYNANRWSVDSEVGRGLQGNEFHGGAEYRLLGRLAFRGGARYSRRQWNPGGGIGFNLTSRFGVDVAAYGTSTNIEQVRKVALALSLRFDRRVEVN